nr:hypothetical protein [uncultured Roseateles sp.]
MDGPTDTGLYFAGQCFADPFRAVDAYISAHHATFFSYEGGCAYKTTAISQNGDGVQIKFLKTLIDGSETQACPATSWVEYVPLPVCDLAPSPWNMSYADGGLVAAAVGSVWIAAWAVRAIRSVLSDRESD